QELITVRVIEKLDSVFRECFAGAIENGCGFARRLFVKRIFVRDPRATCVLDAKQLRLACDVFDVVTALFISKVSANCFEPARVEFLLELLGRNTVSARQLNIRDAKGAHL